MKAVVDLTYIREEHTTGLANFAFKLLQGFRENGFSDSVVLLVESGFEQGFAHRIEGFRLLPVTTGSIPYLPFTRGPLFRRKLDSILEAEGADLLLSPYIYDRSLYSLKVPCIGVIHDTNMFHQANPLLRARFRMGAIAACNRLERIVAISSSTKSAIGDIRAIRTGVEVIYVSVISTADPSSRERVPQPYILDVNTLVEHKNPLTLIKAFELIRDRIPHTLVFKGKRTPYWDEVLEPYIRNSALQERIILNEELLSQSEIDRLYVNADLFVTPSEMEGFGATPIEAALAGVPVICNALPTLVESTRGLVNYYSPARNADALANAILTVLEKRESLESEKIRNIFAEAYSPRHQAECFMELISSVCGKPF